MTYSKAWKQTALWLSLSWSFLWSLVFSELLLTHKLDLYLHDRLIRLTHRRTTPSEILLVPITQTDLQTWGNTTEPTPYVTLIDRLLNAGAAGVIFNLLPNWVQTADHPNNPIKTLIQKHRDRLILILPTSSATQPNPTEWRSYQYFLPTDKKGISTIPPQTILGFAEYEPEDKNPRSLASTARQANLTGQFTNPQNANGFLFLNSFASLSIKKFLHRQKNLPIPTTPIQIQFWGKTGTFPRLDAQLLLSDRSPPLNLRHKIVLVGFSDVRNPDAFAIRSPFGDLMPAVEFQANLLASLLTQTYYRTVPLVLQGLFILLGGLLLSYWIVIGKLHPHYTRNYRYWSLPIFLLLSFGGLSAGLWWIHWLLPPTLPLFVWGVTLCSVFLSLELGVQKALITQQQCEIDRFQTAEQSAIISQARKLMHRLASDIHDGPLQELKLIMDRLELLQMQSPQLPIDPILDQLENLGIHLRQHLQQTRTLSLEITPNLKAGLAQGITQTLTELAQSGELTLLVIHRLQPLKEPELDSQWIEAREDIYRFFLEAIHNVIYHAQPPHGTATTVTVTLTQQETHCTLTIENNGAILAPDIFEPTRQQRQRGGYGTKLLDTIAAELPKGSIERTPLPRGGLRLQLTWEQIFGLNSSV